MIEELLNHQLMNLRNISRYSNCNLIQRENVLEHTAEMQCIAVILNSKAKKLGADFNIENVVYRIAMHDLDEAVMCDLPRDIKYHDEEIHEKIESIAKEKLLNSFSNDIVNEIMTAKDPTTIEGWIVKILDVIQATYKLTLEFRIQRVLQIKNRYSECVNYLEELKDKFKHATDKQTINNFNPILKESGKNRDLILKDLLIEEIKNSQEFCTKLLGK